MRLERTAACLRLDRLRSARWYEEDSVTSRNIIHAFMCLLYRHSSTFDIYSFVSVAFTMPTMMMRLRRDYFARLGSRGATGYSTWIEFRMGVAVLMWIGIRMHYPSYCQTSDGISITCCLEVCCRCPSCWCCISL